METKVIEHGIELDKDADGLYGAYAPAGFYFRFSGLHTIGYAGRTLTEVRESIKEDGGLAVCPENCDGDEHAI